MDEWRQWCELVAVDGSTLTTKNSAFTYGHGSFDGVRITLYGHGVPDLRSTRYPPTGRADNPAQDTIGDAP